MLDFAQLAELTSKFDICDRSLARCYRDITSKSMYVHVAMKINSSSFLEYFFVTEHFVIGTYVKNVVLGEPTGNKYVFIQMMAWRRSGSIANHSVTHVRKLSNGNAYSSRNSVYY